MYFAGGSVILPENVLFGWCKPLNMLRLGIGSEAARASNIMGCNKINTPGVTLQNIIFNHDPTILSRLTAF